MVGSGTLAETEHATVTSTSGTEPGSVTISGTGEKMPIGMIGAGREIGTATGAILGMRETLSVAGGRHPAGADRRRL